MKKFLSLFLAIAFLFSAAPVVKAQQPAYELTMGTTVTAPTDHGQRYFHLTLTGGNVTTFGFSSVEPQNAETVTVVFTQDVSGSRTVGLASNIKGTLTINTTVSTIATFQYDVFTQDWFVITVGHN